MAPSNLSSCPNVTYMKATSDGAWSGERPIDYALPLLIIQLCLVLFFSRVFALILKPLRQPRVIAEILGGVVLGTSVMGRIPGFTAAIFPPKSLPVLTSVANLGLLYFLFTIGLELDVRSLTKIGTKALLIAAAGISIPFGLGVAVSFPVRSILGVSSSYGPFIVFMGVAMSITAFPVLARILAERKLLTTDVGQVAMSAAAVNDVVAWILLALAVALSTPNASPSIVAWILLCGVFFVLVMMLCVRPLMHWAVRGMVGNEPIPEWIVAVTLVGVLVAGFCTDTIGIHGIFGAFVFGLCIPKDGSFATQILEKLEDFTTIILLPLYFASSGLAVNLATITSNSVGVLFIVIGAACGGKIGGTFLACLLAKYPIRKSVVLGILMNTKGLVELIVLNIGLTKHVIDIELYTIMVIMALFTTFMTTPLVMLIYAPARERHAYTKTLEQQRKSSDSELRLLECIWGTQNVPSMLNITEAFRGTRKNKIRVFLMHLVELSERSSAIAMVTRVRKDGRPFWSKEADKKGQDQVVVAFRAYADLSRVNVVPLTCISAYNNMHEDICITAEDRQTSLIVLPYYKTITDDGEEVVNHNSLLVTKKLLRTAPCSVAILVDRGLGGFSQMGSSASPEKHVAVLFFGGADDREALTLAGRMAGHPGVSLTVIHFCPSNEAAIGLEIEHQHDSQSARTAPEQQPTASFSVTLDRGHQENERKVDESALEVLLGDQMRKGSTKPVSEPEAVESASQELSADGEERPPPARASRPKLSYEKREVDDASAALLSLDSENFDLILLGRGRRAPLLVAGLAAQSTPLRSYYRRGSNAATAAEQAPSSPLGPVGDLLASSEIKASILVVQQHDEAMVRSLSTVQLSVDQQQ